MTLRIKQRGYKTIPALGEMFYFVTTEDGNQFIAKDRITAMRDYSLALLDAEEKAREDAMAFYGSKKPQDIEGLAQMFYRDAEKRGILYPGNHARVCYLSERQAEWLNNIARKESAGEIDLFGVDRLVLESGLVITTMRGRLTIQKPLKGKE